MRTISLRSLGIRASPAISYLEEGKLNENPPLVSVLVIKEKYFLLALQLSPAEHETKWTKRACRQLLLNIYMLETEKKQQQQQTKESASIHLFKQQPGTVIKWYILCSQPRRKALTLTFN